MRYEDVRTALRARIDREREKLAATDEICITPPEIRATQFAQEVGCSRPTAMRALREAEGEGYLDARPRGLFHVRTPEERERVVRGRGTHARAVAVVADLEAEGIDAALDDRVGYVRIPADDLRGLLDQRSM